MEYHSVVQRLIELLESHKVVFESFEHEPVRTSEEAAKIRPGYTLKQGTKALIVKLYLRGGVEKYVMLVVPGDARFDSKKVKKLFDAKDLRFATEEEVAQVTGGVQVGGVPPFGSLFGLETTMDPHVKENERVIFNAGDRKVSVAIKVSDFILAESPRVADLI